MAYLYRDYHRHPHSGADRYLRDHRRDPGSRSPNRVRPRSAWMFRSARNQLVIFLTSKKRTRGCAFFIRKRGNLSIYQPRLRPLRGCWGVQLPMRREMRVWPAARASFLIAFLLKIFADILLLLNGYITLFTHPDGKARKVTRASIFFPGFLSK